LPLACELNALLCADILIGAVNELSCSELNQFLISARSHRQLKDNDVNKFKGIYLIYIPAGGRAISRGTLPDLKSLLKFKKSKEN